MLGFKGMFGPVLVAINYRPSPVSVVIFATDHTATHVDGATHCFGFLRAGLPHHSWPAPRVLERIDEGLNDLGAIFRTASREEGVLDRTAKGQAFDALRGPIRRNFPAAHSPNLFGIAFEESVEEAFAELVANPVFEVLRVADWHKTRLQPRQDAKRGFEQAEFHQRFKGP